MAGNKITASLVNDNGTWTVRGMVYDPVTGETHQRSRSTGFKVKGSNKRKAEAVKEEILAEWQAEAEQREKEVSPQFSYFVQKFIERKQLLRKKGNTIKSYQDYIKIHINPALGDIPIQEIALKDIEDFYSEYLKTHTVNSARKVNCVISGAFREAIRAGQIQVNLADGDHLEFPKAEK